MAQAHKPVTVRYAEPDYWEARYQREPALFEWFFGHTALRRILRTYLSKKKPILHVGCGTSNLQEGMAKSGYCITNTDISEVVIQQMKQRHAQYPNMTYRVADCRQMPEFLDCSFGHVLDKGTLDALLCCKQGTENVMRMLVEIYRVLQPGGSFLLVSLGDPTRRLPLLCDAQLPWKVSLLLLPKISAANQAYVDGKPINDSTEPVQALGPFEVVNPDTIMDMPPDLQYSNFFFAYVCKKQPLQLPQHQGQKGQLPNGWVAGSKELFSKLQKELGLPEDLLDKGRRKRVMHVPAGHASMQHYLGNSSNASLTSGNSSPVSIATLHGGCSSSLTPLPPLGDLQPALPGLQAGGQSQLSGSHSVTLVPFEGQHSGVVSSEGSAVQPDIPPRPQSAPNLVAIIEAEAPAAAGAGAVEEPMAAAAAAAASATVQPPVVQPMQQDEVVTTAAASSTLEPALGGSGPTQLSADAVPGLLLSGRVPGATDMPATAQPSPSKAAAAAAAAICADAAVQRQQLQRPAGLLLPELCEGSSAAAGLGSSPVLLHSASSPGWLSACTQEQERQAAGLPAQARMQSPAAMQVLNFAAPAASFAAAAAPGLDGDAGATVSSGGAGAVLEPSPLPPLGKPKLAVSSTPTSPADSPSHASSSGLQQPPVWPGGPKVQAGQAVQQLQGQQAAAVSAAMAAAGMYPHPAAPRGVRVPRLRRFSTEYGALSGSALQLQLEQLRLIQAQHSESAADGLVLHDVAGGEPCGSGAAAAAAVAAAAWGAVRRPRDRRLSNISILSGLSIMSSTSIDESGEDLAFDEPCSTTHTTVVLSSEPSCQLCSPPKAASPRADGASGRQECAAGDLKAMPKGGQPLSPQQLSSEAPAEQPAPTGV